MATTTDATTTTTTTTDAVDQTVNEGNDNSKVYMIHEIIAWIHLMWHTLCRCSLLVTCHSN